jgi:hypothetical protein
MGMGMGKRQEWEQKGNGTGWEWEWGREGVGTLTKQCSRNSLGSKYMGAGTVEDQVWIEPENMVMEIGNSDGTAKGTLEQPSTTVGGAHILIHHSTFIVFLANLNPKLDRSWNIIWSQVLWTSWPGLYLLYGVGQQAKP